MAFENLFIRSKKSIGGIQLDGILIESHSNRVKLSRNPVEIGADVTDHAIVEPKKVSVTAAITDTPLGLAALGQIVDLVTGLFGTSTSSNITRSKAAYNALVQLQEQREPITLQTKLKLYEGMVITDINTSQDKDSSRSVELVIVFEELILTETDIVTLDPDFLLDGSPKEQGSPSENKGRVDPVTPNETINKSVLKAISDWVIGQ